MKEINLDKNGLSEKEYLDTYDINKYKRPSVSNDIIIFTTEDRKEENLRKVPRKGMQVLLVKRKEHPFINKWAIPGGFVKIDEGLYEGAARELKEETGVDKVYIEQLYTYGDVERDPRTRVITVANMALIAKDSVNPKAGNDAKEVKWFWIEKELVEIKKNNEFFEKHHILKFTSEDNSTLIKYSIVEKIKKTVYGEKHLSYELLKESNDYLAFDHYKILDYAIERLRNKIEYTPIAFNLLPRLFTVKELQYVYEGIMGRELLNFRRKIGNMIIETDERIEGKPYSLLKYLNLMKIGSTSFKKS